MSTVQLSPLEMLRVKLATFPMYARVFIAAVSLVATLAAFVKIDSLWMASALVFVVTLVLFLPLMAAPAVVAGVLAASVAAIFCIAALVPWILCKKLPYEEDRCGCADQGVRFKAIWGSSAFVAACAIYALWVKG